MHMDSKRIRSVNTIFAVDFAAYYYNKNNLFVIINNITLTGISIILLLVSI